MPDAMLLLSCRHAMFAIFAVIIIIFATLVHVHAVIMLSQPATPFDRPPVQARQSWPETRSRGCRHWTTDQIDAATLIEYGRKAGRFAVKVSAMSFYGYISLKLYMPLLDAIHYFYRVKWPTPEMPPVTDTVKR